MASDSDFISTSLREGQSKETSEDAILAMTNDYMQQIVRREKTYEFRKYRISSTVTLLVKVYLPPTIEAVPGVFCTYVQTNQRFSHNTNALDLLQLLASRQPNYHLSRSIPNKIALSKEGECLGTRPFSIGRIWFYLNAPHSTIAYICEIDPARTRKPDDDPLPEDGLGNREFNARHEDWDRYDYAYRVKSVRKLNAPLSLRAMKELYGMKIAPRGLVYAPPDMVKDIPLDQQLLL